MKSDLLKLVEGKFDGNEYFVYINVTIYSSVYHDDDSAIVARGSSMGLESLIMCYENLFEP